MSLNDFRKTEQGIVINTNKDALSKAREEQRKILLEKNKVTELENRVSNIESILSEMLSLLKGTQR
jgi:hypothetical protein